jgi:hypothetical protein
MQGNASQGGAHCGGLMSVIACLLRRLLMVMCVALLLID